MKRIILTATLILLSLFIFSQNTNQTDKKTSVDKNTKTTDFGFSINPKVGFYKANKDKEGFTSGVELNVFNNESLFSADYYRFEEFTLFKSPDEYFNQIGLMVGKYNEQGNFRFQYQAGLGLMWGLKRSESIAATSLFNTEFESENFTTIGFIPKLSIQIIPFSFLSLGIDFQANINKENSVFMPLISIGIGKFRN